MRKSDRKNVVIKRLAYKITAVFWPRKRGKTEARGTEFMVTVGYISGIWDAGLINCRQFASLMELLERADENSESLPDEPDFLKMIRDILNADK